MYVYSSCQRIMQQTSFRLFVTPKTPVRNSTSLLKTKYLDEYKLKYSQTTILTHNLVKNNPKWIMFSRLIWKLQEACKHQRPWYSYCIHAGLHGDVIFLEGSCRRTSISGGLKFITKNWNEKNASKWCTRSKFYIQTIHGSKAII